MRIIITLLLCLLFLPVTAKADDFAKLPILHDGRIKPMESFARIHLRLFSGKETIDGLSANEWLQETLFNPAVAFERPVFKITDPDALLVLGLQKRLHGLYALSDIAEPLETNTALLDQLMEQDRNTLSRGQRVLLDVAINKILYSHILRGLSLVMPLNINPPESLSGKLNTPFTIMDYQRIAQDAQNAMKNIIDKKGNDIEIYTDQERHLATFMMQMDMLSASNQNNALFRIIPVRWNESDTWMSPSLLIETGQGSPETAHYLEGWKEAAIAYRSGDKTNLKNAYADLYTQALNLLPDSTTPFRLNLEVFSRNLAPFHKALFFFTLSSLLCAVYAAHKNEKVYKAITIAGFIGFTLLSLGIILRVFILARPPVATLYESALFVAAIGFLFALYIEWKQKNAIGLFSGSIIAVLLIASSGHLVINPDDKEVLSAVLDTNFWLGTHVLSITAGYGACLITAFLAHIYLGLKTFQKRERTHFKTLYNLLWVFALISLMLTAVGTILGGVWADQSWGRFWGWDPKENGALLIVLWIIWTLHGHISGHVGKTELIALLALLNIIVALAWFGVNLLNVGLHSYGFISGIAAGLVAFIAAELFIVSALYIGAKKGEKRHA